MTAQENFDFVNDYLKQISPIIQDHDGFIVKFLGDGMMAIFPYGVDDAVAAGIAKQQMVKAFNAQTAQRGLPPISVGVGIHTGSMMVGMIGEEARLQGDAFSDNVNLTSRVEGLNKFFGTSMIISEDTLALLSHPEAYKMRFLGKAIVKGRIAPLGLYEVYHGLDEQTVARRDAARADFERGLALYSQGQFTAACTAFEAVLACDPTDKTAHYYLESCQRYAAQSVPAGWNGVIVMDSK
jgi:class 3 adenylate cyclase